MVGLIRKKVPTRKEPQVLPRWKRQLSVARRIMVGILLALAGLILILTAVFMFAPSRSKVLGWGVRIADEALPGHLTVGRLDWPAMGHLVFEDVLWVSSSISAPGDTLADLTKLDLSLDLGALMQKEGRVESLLLVVRNLDLPAIVAITADMGASSESDSLTPGSVPEGEPPGFPYLRSGSLPGVPSATLVKLDIEVDRARLAPGLTIREVVLSGRADVRPDHPASAVIDHASARLVTVIRDTTGAASEWEVVLDHLGLGLNLEFPPETPADWNLVSGALDSLTLAIAPSAGSASQEIWQASQPVNLKATARVDRQGDRYEGHFESDFVLPGASHFQPWLPEGFPFEEIGSVSGQLAVEGEYGAPGVRAAVRLDLGSNSWLKKGVISGEAEGDLPALKARGIQALTARLDTLDVSFEGIGVNASGDWRSGDFQANLATVLTDPHLIELFLPKVEPAVQDIWREPGSVSLTAKAGLGRTGGEYSGRLDCQFSLPGASNFQPWLPDDFPFEEVGSVSGHLSLDGDYADPGARAAVRLDLGSNSWINNGVIVGEAEGDLTALKTQGVQALAARLDTLDVSIEGFSVNASGKWKSDDFQVDLATVLTDPHLVGSFLPNVDPAVKEIWRDPDSVSLKAEAGLGRTGGEYSGRLDCQFALPGASHFQPWLPDDFPLEKFESLSGNLLASGNWSEPQAVGFVRLDLGENSWVEKGLITGNASANIDSLLTDGLRHLTASLDTLDLFIEGIQVHASGAIYPESVALDLAAEVTDTLLPGLFFEPALADASLDLKVEAAVAGSLNDPEIDAEVSGSLTEARFTIPSFDFTLAGDRRNVAAFLTAGGGLDLDGTLLDSVSTEVQGELVALDNLSAGFGLKVWQGENRLALGGSVLRDSVRVVQLDSLVAVSSGREMRTRGPATFTMGPDPGVFELTELDFAGDPGTIHAQGFWNEEGRDLDVDIDLLLPEELLQQILPLHLWSYNGGVDLKLEVGANLEGGDGDTRVAGQASAVLKPHRDDPPFGVALDFTSAGGQAAVLNADFALVSTDTALLKAQLHWPGKAGPEGGYWQPDPEKDLVLKVPSQEMDLALINQRLPERVALTGKFGVSAEIHVFPPGKGDAEVDSLAVIPLRGTIEGALKTSPIRVDLPNRSWLNTAVDAKVTGSLVDPKVSGKIEVKAGFIRLPEIPRHLHPVEGESLLWALNDSLLAVLDSTEVEQPWAAAEVDRRDSLVVFLRPELEGPVLAPSGPPVLPELDVEVVVSEDVRIIGYGMDIKLDGQLKVARGYDEDHLPGPALTGDIGIPEGSLKVMNRVFNVERGNIKFTSEVPPNPHFNIMLETQVNAYQVKVLVSGRAAAPVLELTSEPDLTEEDIMAVLLFGQPMNDLDSDQRGRMSQENDASEELRKNLAGLAMAFGAKGLQDSMSESFGVDMVQMGSDSSGASTLMVGKFITPDIILKYNQSLEKSGTYFMTLEYTLNRYFKIVSTYGQGEEATGAEVRWSKRY